MGREIDVYVYIRMYVFIHPECSAKGCQMNKEIKRDRERERERQISHMNAKSNALILRMN